MEDKKEKLLAIIKQLQEMYPHLDRLMVNDLDHPDSIIITSQENLEGIAETTGMDLTEVEGYFDDELDDDQLDLIEWISKVGYDDDDDKGPLQ